MSFGYANFGISSKSNTQPSVEAEQFHSASTFSYLPEMKNIVLMDMVGIGLAVLLILSIFPMPYGYYILIRFFSMIVVVLYVIKSYKK